MEYKITLDDFIKKTLGMYSRLNFKYLEKIERLIGSNETGRLVIIIDLMGLKPKYGEIIHSVNCAVTLKELGFKTDVYIFESKKGWMWEDKRAKKDTVAMSLYPVLRELVSCVVEGTGINVEYIQNQEKEDKIIEDNKGHILFEEVVTLSRTKKSWIELGKQINTFTLYRQFYSIITTTFHKRLLKKGGLFLFGDRLRKKHNGKFGTQKFLTTNYRYNLYRDSKNGNPYDLMKIIKRIYSDYGMPTVVLTSIEGRDHLNELFGNQKGLEFGSTGNFIREMQIASQTYLHYQDQGGGISEVSLLSKDIDYVLTADPMWVTNYSNIKMYRYNRCPGQSYLNNDENYDAYIPMIYQGMETARS